jgi:DNA-binding MarR family transcriptional regulator
VEPTDALVQTAFTVMGVLTRIAAEHELSLTQLRVFGILRDRTPRMAQLAGFLGLEKSTMSGLISRAEQRGLLRRVRSAADARAWDVVMTEEGLEIAARVHRQVQEALAPLVGQFDANDRALLDRLARLVQAAPGGSLTDGGAV